ncbi:hypothetical protein A946_11220 [Methylacidiphilum kamchatkense Kam1]|uniref:Uncharacterized protein n=1 Tax=Methylacidiphilum kamchatkense Kam1 TaxID=1202785 RepID=A0A0C1UML4_9BACT|nr:hypothetical protein A946_11220 [Methylacidiphilum kamchatkense Kam1]QDQ41493.1 hypothetical protein kam1_238 [Methylacidiphilum kamchatkense Kam1]
MGQPKNLLQAIRSNLVQLHAVGVARALVSALDCVAAVVVGVLPLKETMEDISFSRLRNNMRNLIEGLNNVIQQESATRVCNLVSSGQGEEWIDWLRRLRNTWIHRGEQPVFMVDPNSLYGPSRALRAEVTWRLPEDPYVPEVWRMALERLQRKEEGSTGFLYPLREDAVSTFHELLKRSVNLIDAIGKELSEVWDWRRDNCRNQPVEDQWPIKNRYKEAIRKARFKGFAPNAMPSKPLYIVLCHPSDFKRWKTAALVDARDVAQVWGKFFSQMACDSSDVS